MIAVVTIDAPPLPPRRAKAPIVTQPVMPPAEIKLAQADPPPVPTGSEFDVKPVSPLPPATATATASDKPATSTELESLPIDEVRTRAGANDIAAMEEVARRLLQGLGVAKDPQAGAGWLLRAAEGGSAQAAFNVGVMYERGFVVERDSTRAVEWYRKAAEGNMPAAKHNLALMLRDGKGTSRDVKQAIELLRSAARQGMAASMFSLGDIYERGDGGPKDAAAALAWFAIAAEFERQVNRGADTALARSAEQRSQTLQRLLTPAELQRAQQLGQSEFRQIVEALAPPKPAPPPPETPPPSLAVAPTVPPAGEDLPSWPKTAAEQVRAIQQALVDLQLLRDKPDGVPGPMTRNAIREFQRGAGLKETGDPGKDVYFALRQALAKHDVVANSPLPPPPKDEPAKSAPAKSEPPKPEPPTAPIAIDLAKPEAPPPPTSGDLARAMAKADPDAWPVAGSDQVKAIQRLLRELKILSAPADGQNNAATQTAIRQYEQLAGLKETGEPSKAVFDSLKEIRALMAPKKRSN